MDADHLEVPPEEEIVSLCECDSEQELLVIRGLLESAGIECFTPFQLWTSDMTKRDDAFPLLLVRRRDLDAAHEVIDASLQPPPPDEL